MEVRAMRKIVGRLAALAAAGALTFVGLPVASASAGTNGQHVTFCFRGPVNQAILVGVNEKGELVHEGVATMYLSELNAYCGNSDWWWKNNLDIWTGDDNGWELDRTCQVPVWMNDGDTFPC
jgi:hypothetical protein